MTTPNSETPPRFRLPERPEREPDDRTSAQQLSETGLHHHLKQFLGNPKTTIVSAERYITAQPGAEMWYPDLMVAYNVDPIAYRETNGYLISEQGKPPDLVLEIASLVTGQIDVGVKRAFYERLLIPEYWRFDATGEFHGARLAGDRLVNGRYQTIEIVELDEATLQGFSQVLNLNWRWEAGWLGCYDPATDRHIPTFDSERARATAIAAERIARAQDQARIRELEQQLSNRNQDQDLRVATVAARHVGYVPRLLPKNIAAVYVPPATSESSGPDDCATGSPRPEGAETA